MVKLVCDECVPGGLNPDDGAKIAVMVQQAGADAIVANAGNRSTKFFTIPGQESPAAPLVKLARKIKSVVDIPVIAIGKIGDPKLAEFIISENKADFTAMARALVADPDLPLKARQGRYKDIRPCVYCLEDCADKGVEDIGRCCAVNPFAGLEYLITVKPAGKRKKVLVAGGGPAGIQTAILADQRGHDVTLWEKDQQLGGQARLMSMAPHKKEMEKVLDYLIHTLESGDTKVKFGQKADRAGILEFKPDTLILATGACPIIPGFPGINSKHVIAAREIYQTGKDLVDQILRVDGRTGSDDHQRNIIVVGGGDIGCETAEWLAGPEKKITIIELQDVLLNRMKKIPKDRLLRRLRLNRVHTLTRTRLTAIHNGYIEVIGVDGSEYKIDADIVVLALPSLPDKSLSESLKDRFSGIFRVGDAAAPSNLGNALRSAVKTALEI